MDAKAGLLPHYALSHLWGISKDNPHLWEEIGDHVDDENGEPAAAIQMRPEKRNPLLSLLQNHPGSYWWIDVLCARTDTPLGIMGDIYACCKLCYAMIDCAHDIMPRVNSMMELFPKFDNNGVYHFELSQWPLDRYKELFDVLDTLTRCNWWKRVWTLQEAVLPNDVLLIAETHTDISGDNILHIHDLCHLVIAEWILLTEVDRSKEEGYREALGVDIEASGKDSVLHEIHLCRFRYKSLVASDDTDRRSSRIVLLEVFANSPRQCMSAVDYVYGVLGMLQMDIPRKADNNEVWQLFISELNKSLGEFKPTTRNSTKGETAILEKFKDSAPQCDLVMATNMSDLHTARFLSLVNFNTPSKPRSPVPNQQAITVKASEPVIVLNKEHVIENFKAIQPTVCIGLIVLIISQKVLYTFSFPSTIPDTLNHNDSIFVSCKVFVLPGDGSIRE
ncbi:hypothetical protein K492DRAFT_179999 [Lichtheimia hyalospora FSU 10163]|nr:hypothetical protein K492DRAFT_179999 [Lichtheimia hyalospora FSU 10163]